MDCFEELFKIENCKKALEPKNNNNFDEYIARVFPQESKLFIILDLNITYYQRYSVLYSNQDRKILTINSRKKYNPTKIQTETVETELKNMSKNHSLYSDQTTYDYCMKQLKENKIEYNMIIENYNFLTNKKNNLFNANMQLMVDIDNTNLNKKEKDKEKDKVKKDLRDLNFDEITNGLNIDLESNKKYLRNKQKRNRVEFEEIDDDDEDYEYENESSNNNKISKSSFLNNQYVNGINNFSKINSNVINLDDDDVDIDDHDIYDETNRKDKIKKEKPYKKVSNISKIEKENMNNDEDRSNFNKAAKKCALPVKKEKNKSYHENIYADVNISNIMKLGFSNFFLQNQINKPFSSTNDSINSKNKLINIDYNAINKEFYCDSDDKFVKNLKLSIKNNTMNNEISMNNFLNDDSSVFSKETINSLTTNVNKTFKSNSKYFDKSLNLKENVNNVNCGDYKLLNKLKPKANHNNQISMHINGRFKDLEREANYDYKKHIEINSSKNNFENSAFKFEDINHFDNCDNIDKDDESSVRSICFIYSNNIIPIISNSISNNLDNDNHVNNKKRQVSPSKINRPKRESRERKENKDLSLIEINNKDKQNIKSDSLQLQKQKAKKAIKKMGIVSDVKISKQDKKSKSRSKEKYTESDNFYSSEFSEHIYSKFNECDDNCDEEENLEKFCLCCNWKFPSFLNKRQINNHVNICLDGNGPENIRSLMNE